MKRTGGVPRPCEECGEVFTPVGEFKGYSRKFCSQPCSDQAKRKPVFLRCAECGVTFETKPSKAKEGRKYCSRVCWAKNSRLSDEQYRKNSERMHVERRGPANPMYKHGAYSNRAWRAKFNLGVKGEKCCRHCGSTLMLHLHHAIPRSVSRAARDEIRNGITLCNSCHMKWHRRSLTLYRDVFSADEWAYLTSVSLTGQSITAWLDDHYPVRPVQEAA